MPGRFYVTLRDIFIGVGQHGKINVEKSGRYRTGALTANGGSKPKIFTMRFFPISFL